MVGNRKSGLLKGFALCVVIAVYLYPTFRTRVRLGPATLPPMFAPDLTMYLNLSKMTSVGDGKVWNPYYRIPVPANGSGYLKFRVAPRIFGALSRSLHQNIWLSLLIWNTFWWTLLCVFALWLFDRFLPEPSCALSTVGLALLMLFNFGVLRTVVLGWLQLPSYAGFYSLSLPFMRAFIPVIPAALLLAYIALQMKALEEQTGRPWIGMALMQLLALAVFPYATLMMIGVTTIGVLNHIRIREKATWVFPLVYGIACACVDCIFLFHGSIGFYNNHGSPIHFQPQLLPKLIGGNWILMVALTAGVVLRRRLPSAVRWTLVGLGGTNAVLMLGDVVIPASTILLSHHAAHFVQLTIAVLGTFLLASSLPNRTRREIWIRRGILALSLAIAFLSGLLLAIGNYEGTLAVNRKMMEVQHLQDVSSIGEGDLVIASSEDADDVCGWIVLLSNSTTLYCTDAEVMLTPQQNWDIQRFREALYLYLRGKDSSSLQRALGTDDPSQLMYRLGYWAEAASLSPAERNDGIRAIQGELIPWLERVEHHDAVVPTFFRAFRRVIVIEDETRPFSAERLDSFLRLEAQQERGDLVMLFFSPK